MKKKDAPISEARAREMIASMADVEGVYPLAYRVGLHHNTLYAVLQGYRGVSDLIARRLLGYRLVTDKFFERIPDGSPELLEAQLRSNEASPGRSQKSRRRRTRPDQRPGSTGGSHGGAVDP